MTSITFCIESLPLCRPYYFRTCTKILTTRRRTLEYKLVSVALSSLLLSLSLFKVPKEVEMAHYEEFFEDVFVECEEKV